MSGTPDWTARQGFELKHVGVRCRLLPVRVDVGKTSPVKESPGPDGHSPAGHGRVPVSQES